jgi:hypothetical protein
MRSDLFTYSNTTHGHSLQLCAREGKVTRERTNACGSEFELRLLVVQGHMSMLHVSHYVKIFSDLAGPSLIRQVADKYSQNQKNLDKTYG